MEFGRTQPDLPPVPSRRRYDRRAFLVRSGVMLGCWAWQTLPVTSNRSRLYGGEPSQLAPDAVSVPPANQLPNQLPVEQQYTDNHQARLLYHDSTSLQQRLELVDSADHEVLLSAYEIGDDPVALRILSGLRAAAQRGVCVKLMVDGHGRNNLIPKPMMKHLVEQGVAIREHMPDARYRLELGRQRMHDKLLVVDGQRLIIGGRNVRADYYGLANQAMIDVERAEKNRIDREVYVDGPIAKVVRHYFLQRWNADTSGPPSLDRTEKRKTIDAQQLSHLNKMSPDAARNCAARLLDQAWATPLPFDHHTSQLQSLACTGETVHQLSCVRFLHDVPENPKDCPAAIAQQLSRAISAAKTSVLLETPYLVLSKDLRRRLAELTDRGVDVCVLTNSLETADRMITHAQYANERHLLLSAGIQLWETKGARHLHAKSLVIDGYRSMVGSYNFDMLSETRNSETAMLIDDTGFADDLTRQIAQHLVRARPVSRDEPLIGFDARTNDVDQDVLREARVKRLISPWIKKYL
ncbi:MAG: phosphatidylserine/phosphatidylglycerophosphate/cardiolipin synthase family protein [Pirellulaceae bacterium]|nr:phosphatidylserine/phosphatidylglycerophosphate/cardiolipin synthase family protein [Pirellulaceae bacterium]